eukprot:9640920-Heterocapsa_arctica.AAC.2
MSNKSKNGVDTGVICEPNKIGERPNNNFQDYKQCKYNRRKGHIGPGCWHKTRNNNINNCHTTYSGKEADSPILGLPKVFKNKMTYGPLFNIEIDQNL